MQQKSPKKFSLTNYLTAALGIIVVLGLVYALANYWPTHASESQPSHTSDVAKNENLEAGEAYMARIAETPGMESLGGGIYYKVLAEGNGPKPTQESRVRVHYEGRLIDGTVFDFSYQRNEPTTFPVNGVIAGWQIALKAMPVGSTWEVYIPQYYAYGAKGSGRNIPPYSALIFKVELLGIE